MGSVAEIAQALFLCWITSAETARALNAAVWTMLVWLYTALRTKARMACTASAFLTLLCRNPSLLARITRMWLTAKLKAWLTCAAGRRPTAGKPTGQNASPSGACSSLASRRTTCSSSDASGTSSPTGAGSLASITTAESGSTPLCTPTLSRKKIAEDSCGALTTIDESDTDARRSCIRRSIESSDSHRESRLRSLRQTSHSL